MDITVNQFLTQTPKMCLKLLNPQEMFYVA